MSCDAGFRLAVLGPTMQNSAGSDHQLAKLAVMSHMTLARWERVTEAPLMMAAVAFLVAYAVPILNPDLPDWAATTCRWCAWVAWALFVADYLARLLLATNRRRYILRHPLDLLVIVLPLLRPLRLLRLIALLTVLNRRVGTRLRGRLAVYVAGGAALLAFCAALAVLDAERSSPDANITSFGDATWWAITTMTTVGYGDQYPVTTVGRLVGVTLMLGGITLLGVVTATLASWLVEAVEAEQQESDDMRAEIRTLHQKLDQLVSQQGEPSQRADTT
jgi:voltage-gated potassium channel